jgi:hypothetical protein
MTYPIGFDINNPGASEQTRYANTDIKYAKDAIVVDVILNEKHPEYIKRQGACVGDILVRMLPEQQVETDLNKLNWVSPEEVSIIDYPLKYEMVSVYFKGGKLRYSRRLNLTRTIAESSSPQVIGRFISQKTSMSSTDMSLRAQGVSVKQTEDLSDDTKVIGLFANLAVRPLRVCDGDFIVQGRFGNSIRMGSSLVSNPDVETPKPNILISAGQWQSPVSLSTTSTSPYAATYEYINEDKSLIWLVTDETIHFKPSTRYSQASSKAHLRSSGIERGETPYTGAQIFINSDRVLINSKVNEVSLFSNTEINLSSIRSITLDTEESVFITANNDITLDSTDDIFVTGSTISFDSSNDISHKARGNYSILGQKIFIGTTNDVSQPMVLGGELSSWLNDMLDVVKILVQVSTVASGLATNPAQAALVAANLLSLTTKLGAPGVPQSATFNSKVAYVSQGI